MPCISEPISFRCIKTVVAQNGACPRHKAHSDWTVVWTLSGSSVRPILYSAASAQTLYHAKSDLRLQAVENKCDRVERGFVCAYFRRKPNISNMLTARMRSGTVFDLRVATPWNPSQSPPVRDFTVMPAGFGNTLLLNR